MWMDAVYSGSARSMWIAVYAHTSSYIALEAIFIAPFHYAWCDTTQERLQLYE